jgi:NAD/NADP transhydrogenase beta subunit
MPIPSAFHVLALGALVGRSVEMTAMPELVAAMRSLGAWRPRFIAIAAVNNLESMGLHAPIAPGHKLEL